MSKSNLKSFSQMSVAYSIVNYYFFIKVPILKEVNLGKMQLCRVEHLLNTFSTYLSSKLDSTLCNQNIGERESNIDDKYVEKVFNKCST